MHDAPDSHPRAATPSEQGATEQRAVDQDAAVSTPRAWPSHGSEPGPDLALFRVRHDLLENPRTGQVLRRLVLETRDWVNVVARTAAGEYVLVRQYRFGLRRVTTEIPGGVIDAGEDHLSAAQRELAEETGHSAQEWRYLGCTQSNPAYQDNVCHHWLALGAVQNGAQQLDPGEDIEVLRLGEAELRAALASGEIGHSLVWCALARVLDLRGLGAPGAAADSLATGR
jgi:ADP-ribose pyrophosphatase